MERVIKLVALLAMFGALGACSRTSLNPTFGHRYGEIFTLQGSDRAGPPPVAQRAEEDRRIIMTYYYHLLPPNLQQGAGGMSSSMQGGYSASSLSPIATPTSSSAAGQSGLDLRAR